MRTKQIHLRRLDWIKIVGTITLLTTLSACTTAGNAIPQGGPTMAQVYEEAMQQSNGNTLDQARMQVKPLAINITKDEADYTRTSANEINNLFPALPNPQLIMYVFPHLADTDQAPVPGYSTAFFLYNQNYYALQGKK